MPAAGQKELEQYERLARLYKELGEEFERLTKETRVLRTQIARVIDKEKAKKLVVKINQ